jgi:CheY-like chemotaxis protein
MTEISRSAASAPPMPARRVMVVDDNVDAAQSLAMLLVMMGCETETAHDGLQALDRAAIFRPDVMLLDLEMPRLDGRETCRRLRAQPWGSGITIVAVSGWDLQHEAESVGQFDLHLVKPIDLQKLARLLTDMSMRAAVPK